MTEVSPDFNADLLLNDRPYIQIIEEHQSLAPVIDLQLRSAKAIQNELLVVSGSNYSSKINIIRKGISIKDHVTLSQLPVVHAQNGLNCVNDMLLIKLMGF